jgi:hypothetical protein
MPRPFHPPWFDHLNNIWWSAQITKVPIMQSASTSRVGRKFSSAPFSNTLILRVPFEKFVDSSYYSESERCGGAVSFSKHLPRQAIHFLQRSTHFSKTCCRPFAASFRRIVEQAVLTSELPFYGWKSPEIAWGEMWTVWRKRIGKWIGGTSLEHPPYSPDLGRCDF